MFLSARLSRWNNPQQHWKWRAWRVLWSGERSKRTEPFFLFIFHLSVESFQISRSTRINYSCSGSVIDRNAVKTQFYIDLWQQCVCVSVRQTEKCVEFLLLKHSWIPAEVCWCQHRGSFVVKRVSWCHSLSVLLFVNLEWLIWQHDCHLQQCWISGRSGAFQVKNVPVQA